MPQSIEAVSRSCVTIEQLGWKQNMSEALVNDAALGTNAAGEDLVSGGGPIVSIGTQDVGSGFSGNNILD